MNTVTTATASSPDYNQDGWRVPSLFSNKSNHREMKMCIFEMYILEFYWIWKKQTQHNKDKHYKIWLKITVDMCVKPDKSKSYFSHWDFSCGYTCYTRRANWTTPTALIGSYIAKSLLYSVDQTMSFSVTAHPLMDLLTTAIAESKVEINFWRDWKKKKNHTQLCGHFNQSPFYKLH